MGTVGLFGRPELSLAAMLLPGVVAGLLVAPFIAERIDRRRLCYAILESRQAIDVADQRLNGLDLRVS